MTLKNNRTHLLSNIKLCASFNRYMWIQTGVTVRKRLSGVMTSVTLTFDLWPWPFGWTSLLSMVITPENFVMIRWQEHGEKCVTDGQTDGRTDWSVLRAAWSQLKISICVWVYMFAIYKYMYYHGVPKRTGAVIFKSSDNCFYSSGGPPTFRWSPMGNS